MIFFPIFWVSFVFRSLLLKQTLMFQKVIIFFCLIFWLSIFIWTTLRTEDRIVYVVAIRFLWYIKQEIQGLISNSFVSFWKHFFVHWSWFWCYGFFSYSVFRFSFVFWSLFLKQIFSMFQKVIMFSVYFFFNCRTWIKLFE